MDSRNAPVRSKRSARDVCVFLARGLALALLILGGVFACIFYLVVRESTTYSKEYSEEKFESLRVGMSKAEILRIMGTPLTIWDKEIGTERGIGLREDTGEYCLMPSSDSPFPSPWDIDRQRVYEAIFYYSKQGDPTANYQERYVVFSTEGRVVKLGKGLYID